MLSVVGILLGLALLVFLALKDWNIIIASLLGSLVVIALSGVPLKETLYEAYMVGFKNWAGNFYLMLAGGSIFAKLMEDTGSAQVISNFIMRLTGRDNVHKIFIGIWLVTTLLVYAGINVWVIVFVMMPIIYPIFKELDLPWHIALAVFCLGANCIGNYLPGAVTIYNITPMKYLGTTAMAGWKISLLSDTTSTIAGFVYIFYQLRKAKARGEHFVKPARLNITELDNTNLPNTALAFAPIIVTLFTLNIFKLDVFFALSLGSITCIALMYKNIPSLLKTLNQGAANVGLPVIGTCAVVGFGSVVAAVPGFETVTNAIINGIPGSPYVSWVISVNALAGITGSASGGLGIAMEALLPKYMNLGLNPEVLHRLAALACCGLDSLPQNGAVITIMTIFGLTHKDGYKHYFWISVVFTVLSCIPGLLAAYIFY